MTAATPTRLHQFVTVVGDDGEELAIGSIQASAVDGSLRLHHIIRGKGRLLEYYFVQGRRAIHIDTGDLQLAGIIATRWVGAERVWEVRLSHSAPDHGIRPPLRTVAAAG